MIYFSKCMLATALAACFAFVGDASTANAQGFNLSIGSGSCGGYGSGYRVARPVYGHGYNFGQSYHSNYRSHYAPAYRSGRYHDTSHFDYHPTEIRRHGNHYDVFPGHYDLHRTGHWHH